MKMHLILFFSFADVSTLDKYFAILEPQNDVSELNKICRSLDPEAFKLQNGRPGCNDFIFPLPVSLMRTQVVKWNTSCEREGKREVETLRKRKFASRKERQNTSVQKAAIIPMLWHRLLCVPASQHGT